jgi:hypothetical protein
MVNVRLVVIYDWFDLLKNAAKLVTLGGIGKQFAENP